MVWRPRAAVLPGPVGYHLRLEGGTVLGKPCKLSISPGSRERIPDRPGRHRARKLGPRGPSPGPSWPMPGCRSSTLPDKAADVWGRARWGRGAAKRETPPLVRADVIRARGPWPSATCKRLTDNCGEPWRGRLLPCTIVGGGPKSGRTLARPGLRLVYEAEEAIQYAYLDGPSGPRRGPGGRAEFYARSGPSLLVGRPRSPTMAERIVRPTAKAWVTTHQRTRSRFPPCRPGSAHLSMSRALAGLGTPSWDGCVDFE